MYNWRLDSVECGYYVGTHGSTRNISIDGLNWKFLVMDYSALMMALCTVCYLTMWGLGWGACGYDVWSLHTGSVTITRWAGPHRFPPYTIILLKNKCIHDCLLESFTPSSRAWVLWVRCNATLYRYDDPHFLQFPSLIFPWFMVIQFGIDRAAVATMDARFTLPDCMIHAIWMTALAGVRCREENVCASLNVNCGS